MKTISKPMAGNSQEAAPARWGALGALGLLTFAVVTTEMLPVGLLTPIGASLGATPGRAGHMLSVPALAAAACAPLSVLFAGGVDRRRILAGLAALLAAANLACYLAPSLAWLLAARLAVGLCIGGVWAIAGGLATRLAPPAAQGLATSLIFGGVAAASVAGVPIGVFLGELLGWRAAFACMALFCALVLALLLRTLPPLPVHTAIRPGAFGMLLREPGVRRGLLLTLLLVVGHFMAYTYVRPILQQLGNASAQAVGPLLLGYGIAGVAGNFVAGIAAARRLRPTLALIAAGLTLALAACALPAATGMTGLLVLLPWGLAYGGVSVALMTWMGRAAPAALEAATALYIAVFNAAIALGAFAGGRVVDTQGLRADLLLAAGLAALALVLLRAGGPSRT